MIPSGVKNPFLTHKADDTVLVPGGDVPELHAHVLTKCHAALGQARHTGTSFGLLVQGEAGSGKSHLIAQLRKRFAGDPSVVLAAIRMGKAYAGRLWRHLRERLVEELLRQYPPPEQGTTGLLRILRNRFPSFGANAQGASGSMLDWLVGRSPGAELGPHLDEFARTCPLDYNLVQVLPAVGKQELTRVANDWLQGKQLGTKDLQRLGLPPVFPSEQEQEVQAQEVVLSLFRLAGDRTTLVLCFDEVEAIQAGTWDTGVLRQFTTLVTALLAESGPRVVMTCVRPFLMAEIRKVVEASNVQKMAQEQTYIPTLTREQTVRVALSRLEAEPTCKATRLEHPDDPYWPLGEKFLAATFEEHSRTLTPRHLITVCRAEFDRLQGGASPVAKPTPSRRGPAPPVTPGEFARGWEAQRKKHLELISAIPFDTVMGIGLPWLVHLTDLPFVLVRDANPNLRDVNLVFQSTANGRKPVGVSFCNHEPRPLPWRLDRVKKQWAASRGADLDSLVVLRSEAERTTPTATARLESMREAGIRVVLVRRQQLAELAAFQVMMTKSLEGKLIRYGVLVEPAQYDAWVKGHLSEAVKEFFHLVFEPDGAEALAGPTPARK